MLQDTESGPEDVLEQPFLFAVPHSVMPLERPQQVLLYIAGADSVHVTLQLRRIKRRSIARWLPTDNLRGRECREPCGKPYDCHTSLQVGSLGSGVCGSSLGHRDLLNHSLPGRGRGGGEDEHIQFDFHLI